MAPPGLHSANTRHCSQGGAKTHHRMRQTSLGPTAFVLGASQYDDGLPMTWSEISNVQVWFQMILETYMATGYHFHTQRIDHDYLALMHSHSSLCESQDQLTHPQEYSRKLHDSQYKPLGKVLSVQNHTNCCFSRKILTPKLSQSFPRW